MDFLFLISFFTCLDKKTAAHLSVWPSRHATIYELVYTNLWDVLLHTLP